MDFPELIVTEEHSVFVRAEGFYCAFIYFIFPKLNPCVLHAVEV